MGIAAFTAGVAVLVLTGVVVAATMRLRGTAFALAVYLVGWAEVVFLAEALSLFDAVGRTGYLVGEAALLVLAAAAWQLRGRQLPRLPRVGVTRTSIRAQPELVVLAAVVLGAIGYQAFLAVATPPNNYDSLTYHLTRAVAWLQQGHVGYFDAATARANAFPPDGEIGILYTLALVGRDTFAALPQLVAELAVLVAVHGIARRIGFSRSAALFAALLTATLSELALESVTTQNDLVVASFVAAAVLFVVDGRRRLLPFAGLAIGLAVGTKLTGLLALPILAVAALALLTRRRLVELAACAAVAFVGFGAYGYVENLAHTGHVLGVVPEADAYRPEVTAGGSASTAARIYWRFVDFSGLDPPRSLTDGLASAGQHLFATAGIAANPAGATAGYFSFQPDRASSEDTSYFGVLGFLLVIPLSVGVLGAWLARRATRARGVLAAALPVFVLTVALTQRYDHWLGRFMLIPVALTMPLAAFLFERRLRLLTAVAVALGASGLLATHLHNIAKPPGLDGSRAVWQLPRGEAQALLAGPMRQALPAIDRAVPAGAKLGAVLQTNDPAYLLYGQALRRRVVVIAPHEVVRETTEGRLRWLLLRDRRRSASSLPGWCGEHLAGGWELFARRGAQASSSICAGGADGLRTVAGR